MPILAAVAISITIDLGPKPKAAKVTCHHGAVSYRFVGAPGTRFVYDGESFVVPQAGSIELVADSKDGEYVLAGQSHAIEPGPTDAFGTQTVTLHPEPKGVIHVAGNS